MKLTLTVHGGWGTNTIISLYKDENSPASKNYNCNVIHEHQTSQGTIPIDELQDLFTLIRTARITPIISCEFLLDVSTYILKIEDELSSAEYEWSVTNEKGWKKLDKIAGKLLAFGRKISGFDL